MTDRITAIVPARGGSTRLPGKNMRELNGRPLLFHTLDAALGHEEISRVIFTSDSAEYLERVEGEFGDRVTRLHRPAQTAQNTSKVTEEVARILDEHGDLFSGPWFALFLPTAPLRDWQTTREVLDVWRADKRPVFTCNEMDFPAQFSFTLGDDGAWEPLLGDRSPMITGNTRSQDIPKTYRPNGAIYITRSDVFAKRHILYDAAFAVAIDREKSIDVDGELDFAIAEIMLGKRREERS